MYNLYVREYNLYRFPLTRAYNSYKMYVMAHEIDSAQLRITLRDVLDAVQTGETYTITRWGKPIATIAPVVFRAKQVEPVVAAAPSHRPVPTDAIIVNTASDTTTSGTPRTWAQRNPEQAERDKILGGMKPNKRKDEIPK